MAVVLVIKKNNRLEILFNNDLSIIYNLHDSKLAELWIHKIRHLQTVPIDPVESQIEDLSNFGEIYKQFCQFANIDQINIEPMDQSKCNKLHKIYEDHHERLSRINNNSILYKFHHAIHFNEMGPQKHKISVGWGTHEGLLTTKLNCNKFYEDKIIRNNMYLAWAELGKTPLTYWMDNEPNNQERFNTLAKPHITFQASFFIATEHKKPTELDKNFLEWFDDYKESWLTQYNIDKWDHIDEESAPLLATTDYDGDLTGLKVKKIKVC